MLNLPSDFNYVQSLDLDKGIIKQQQVLYPYECGNTFGPGQMINIKFPTSNYLIPNTLSIRFKIQHIGSASAGVNYIRATPVYTPYQRINTIIDGSYVENLTNANIIHNMNINLTKNYAQKVGNSLCLGYTSGTAPNSSTFDFNISAPNGGGCSTATSANPTIQYLSSPLSCCMLYNCDKILPLGNMKQINMEFYTDSLSNMYGNIITNPITNYIISNFELVYDELCFPEHINSTVINSSPQINIRSKSYTMSSVPIPIGSVGIRNLIFNMKFASIRSLFGYFQGNTSNTVAQSTANGPFDSCDVTSGGTYQFNINNNKYPKQLLNCSTNKGGIYQELYKAVGENEIGMLNCSINPTEFNYVNNSTTTIQMNGKFYIGVSLNTTQNKSFISGVSSKDSIIGLDLNISVATTKFQIASVVALYDVIIVIDSASKTTRVIS